MPSGPFIRFGVFELNLDTGEIRKRGRKIKLSPQPFRMLQLLASRPGQLVDRETIRTQLWGQDTFVDFEHGMNFCVREIRDVLGDNAKHPRYIETLPRRGYRFIAEITSANHFHESVEASPASNGNDSSSNNGIQIEHTVPAIAVLEFQNLSGDENIDWLATGIAESLTADLKTLPSIQVVSLDRVRGILRQTTTAADPSPDGNFTLLGQRTGADFIVTGSYQRAGTRIRIIPQLCDLRTGNTVSAFKLDGAWDEIFDLQDRIAARLIGALEIRADSRERQRIAAPETLRIEAYEEYSKGRRALNRMGKGSLEEARQHFDRALALDGRYAMAHSALGATHAMRFIHRSDPADLVQARSHLQDARNLDPELAEPYPWLCYVHIRGGDLTEAVATGKRAIELQPDLVHAQYFLGLAYFVSCELDRCMYQKAADHLIQATHADPRWQASWFVLAYLCLLHGNYDKAEYFSRQLLEYSRDLSGAVQFVGAEFLLGTVWLRRRDYGNARKWFRDSLDALSRSNHMYRDAMRALSACGIGDADLRLGCPERSLTAYRQSWEILQEYPGIMAHDRISARTLAGLAAAYSAMGEGNRARDVLAQALEITQRAGAPQHAAAGANLSDLNYAIAIAHLRCGNIEPALDSLEAAVKSGWRDAHYLKEDSELIPLRKQSRFQSLIQQSLHWPEIEFDLKRSSRE